MTYLQGNELKISQIELNSMHPFEYGFGRFFWHFASLIELFPIMISKRHPDDKNKV